MNSREQSLRKHNERLAAQVHFLLDIIDRMAADHELLGSVACAFAWDLQRDYEDLYDGPLGTWETAARKAEEVP